MMTEGSDESKGNRSNRRLRGSLTALRQSWQFTMIQPVGQSQARGQPVADKISPYWLLVAGLLQGLLLCAVFSVSWKYFGDIYFSQYSRLRLIPAVLTITCLSMFEARQLSALADTMAGLYAGRSRQMFADDTGYAGQLIWVGCLAIVLSLMIKFAVLLAMPYHTPWWPTDWRRYFNFVYPRVHLRVLILLAIWGKAGILIAAGTGRDDNGLSESARSLREAMTVRQLVKCLLPVLVLTAVYFSNWQNRALGLLVGITVFAVAYLASMALSWTGRGHRDSTMLACGELAQLVLLLGYLAISKLL